MLGQIEIDLAHTIIAERAEALRADRFSRAAAVARDGPPRLRSAIAIGLIKAGTKIMPAPPRRPQTDPPS